LFVAGIAGQALYRLKRTFGEDGDAVERLLAMRGDVVA
jgi:hypothetical protein